MKSERRKKSLVNAKFFFLPFVLLNGAISHALDTDLKLSEKDKKKFALSLSFFITQQYQFYYKRLWLAYKCVSGYSF